ncbi:MAG: hypothetical protein AB1Z98_15120 [Nannocystaceae bacterium]
MRSRLGLPLVLCLPLLALGCGDDSSTDDTAGNPSTGTTTETPATGTDTTPPATDDGNTTDATETSSLGTTEGPDTDSADTTAGSTGPAGDCQVWEITYDLEGSEFEVSDTPFGAGDQVNTVTMPYDADDHVGPGTFVLRFEDVDGAPGGMAAMVSYDMIIQFVVDGVTTVTTDITSGAGPDECGVTTGMLDGTTVAWMPAAIVGHQAMGQILCEGALCAAGGLPNGMPVPVDEMTDQPVNDFVFSDDLTTFSMAEVVIGMDDTSTQSWLYEAVEVSRELVDGPECLCP